MMNRLFIDSAMSELNPEFATIEMIDSLMEAANDHPFKDDYLSKLEIAKELITFGVIESGTSNVNRFTPFIPIISIHMMRLIVFRFLVLAIMEDSMEVQPLSMPSMRM